MHILRLPQMTKPIASLVGGTSVGLIPHVLGILIIFHFELLMGVLGKD
jgi:hypothetical protein